MNDFQQEFMRWLDSARAQLSIAPLFEEIAFQSLRYRFDGHIPRIALFVSPNAVDVHVFRREIDLRLSWDRLFHRSSCKPQRCTIDGYFDDGSVCAEHQGRPYLPTEDPSRMLAEHCFHPLQEWINAELMPAQNIIFGEEEGATWAALESSQEPSMPAMGDETEQDFERVKLGRGSSGLRQRSRR